MYWISVVSFLALLVLILSGVLLVLVRRRRVEPLPDGDYLVTIVETRETPQGVATTFRVDGPKEFQGRKVTIVKEERE